MIQRVMIKNSYRILIYHKLDEEYKGRQKAESDQDNTSDACTKIPSKINLQLNTPWSA